MILEGTNGRRLEVSLVGYEFPAEEEDAWDANWLIVRIAAADDPDAWTAEDACLLTWEVDELASWLDALAEPPAEVADLEFVEPSLAFERIEANGAACVRVWFDDALRPPEAPPDDDVLIDLEVGPAALRAAAASLRAQRERFPRRGPAT